MVVCLSNRISMCFCLRFEWERSRTKTSSWMSLYADPAVTNRWRHKRSSFLMLIVVVVVVVVVAVNESIEL